MGDVIFLEDNFYAKCGECGGQDFMLMLNGPGDKWTFIAGTECSACGLFTSFTVVKNEEDNHGL